MPVDNPTLREGAPPVGAEPGTVGTERPVEPQAVEIREIPLRAAVLEATALRRVDYADAFRLATPRARDRTAKGWARALLEDAPAATRRGLRRGWRVLGVRLGPTEDRRRVLGWAVRESSPDHAVLAARSLLGMNAEVHVEREDGAVLVATVMELGNPLARGVWALVSPRHRSVVRHLLGQAGRRGTGRAKDS